MIQAILRIPYGKAIDPGPETDIGSLIDAAGLFVTPVFVAGDVLVTQDDAVGDDNIDTLPSLDGTRVQLAISVAEASPPAACAGARVITLDDQTSPDAWLPIQVRIETEDHPLAYDTKGCIASLLGAAAGQTATNVRFTSAPQNPPVAGMYVECRKVGNTPRSGYVKSYVAGATFDITLYVAMPDGAIDDTWTIFVYADARAPTQVVEHEGTIKTLDALDTAQDSQHATTQAKTDNLPTDPADQSLIIAATDALLARHISTGARDRINARETLGLTITIGAGAHTGTAVLASDQASKALDGKPGLVLTGSNAARAIRFTSDSDGSGAFTYTDWFGDAFGTALAENDTVQVM
jgi:hypothetical protein